MRVKLHELGVRASGRAGIVFKPPAGEFVRGENELQEALDLLAVRSSSGVRRTADDFGLEWLVFDNSGFDDLVDSVALAAAELQKRKVGPLLAALFRFDERDRAVYWIYGFERDAWWPFVPTGEEKQRDNEREIELRKEVERELPVERDLSQWLALYDAPV